MQTDELLISLEKSLLLNEVRSNLYSLNTLLHEQFCEISQSGKFYLKHDVIQSLTSAEKTGSRYEATNFQVRFLADDIAQVSFETRSIPRNDTRARRALRSSIWKNSENGWQMIFHQGTIVPDE